MRRARTTGAGGPPTDVTQDEAAAFVWGPWEFLPAAAVQIASNRQSRPRPYSRPSGKNWDLLPLMRTRPGRWMSTYRQEQWQSDFEGQPIRLLITARHEGYEPWTLLKEVFGDVPRPRSASRPSRSTSQCGAGIIRMSRANSRPPCRASLSRL